MVSKLNQKENDSVDMRAFEIIGDVVVDGFKVWLSTFEYEMETSVCHS